jgi:RNA polymerase sigma-70 factor (ECF subfamily)
VIALLHIGYSPRQDDRGYNYFANAGQEGVTFRLYFPFIRVMDEERLLIEAAQKDRRRFAELYERNFERVYLFIVRRLLDRHDAEDVTAEVFQHALANLDRFEWRGVPFAAWLYRIAANAMADRRKERSREPSSQTIDDLAQSHWPDIERRVVLFKLVDGLPDDQRSVIIKRFVEEKSIRDIAQEFGRTEGAIKQLQFRALQTLRARAGGSHE